jgi:2-octaprenyl-6-methoxyphenol hydroxylase
LWPDIAVDAQPSREIRVADDNSPLFLHYDHRELAPGTDNNRANNNAPLGYIVENRILRRALLARAAMLPSLKLLAPQTVAAMQASETGAAVLLGDGARLRTRVPLRADRHLHDRRASAPAWRHSGRAFPAGRPVRDIADDR